MRMVSSHGRDIESERMMLSKRIQQASGHACESHDS